MSHIGQNPIKISNDLHLHLEDHLLTLKGKLGTLTLILPKEISLTSNHKEIVLKSSSPPLWGTYRSLIKNMVVGVSQGYMIRLQLIGLGYKVYLDNNILYFKLGLSHLIGYRIPTDIHIEVKTNLILIKGINKEQVYNVATFIRSLKSPEPYKGKGIRFIDEWIKLKAGKKK